MKNNKKTEKKIEVPEYDGENKNVSEFPTAMLETLVRIAGEKKALAERTEFKGGAAVRAHVVDRLAEIHNDLAVIVAWRTKGGRLFRGPEEEVVAPGTYAWMMDELEAWLQWGFNEHGDTYLQGYFDGM